MATIGPLWRRGPHKLFTHIDSILNNPGYAESIAPRSMYAIKSCLEAFTKTDFSVEDHEDASRLLEKVIWPLQMQAQRMSGRPV